MVSIIVPVYNVQEYLDRCIKSVLSQTYTDWELLLIDDGSTDSSGIQCDWWGKQDKRIRVSHQQNNGQGPARNLGVELSQGEILAFLDPDDWVEPDFLQAMLDAMGDSDIVFCDYFLERKSGTQYGRRYTWLDAPTSLQKCPRLLYTMGAATWNKLYRRSLWARVKLKQPAHAFEDTAAMPYLWAHAEKIAQLRRLLNHYWIDRPGSTTNLPSKLPEMLLTIQELVEGMERLGLRKSFEQYLAKYCAMALAIPLSRLSGEQQAQRLSAESFFYEQFPSARQFDALPIIVLGGRQGAYLLEKTCFLRTEFTQVEIAPDSLERLSKRGFAGNILIEISELPDANADIIIDALRSLPQCRLFLLKNFWVKGYGVYGVDTLFPQQAQIAAANEMLCESYSHLQKAFPEMAVLEETNYAFTDFEFVLGCRPCYRNNYYYYTIADRLRQLLGGII